MRARVVVVEDDVVALRTYTRLIEGLGCDALPCESVGAALKNVATPDAWLIDYHLPDGTGVELVERVRGHGVRSPAMVMSSDCSMRIAAESAQANCLFHPKPVHMAALALLIAEARRQVPIATQIGHTLRLTEGQQEVVELRLRGVPRGGIAAALSISEDAVKSRIGKILRKASSEGFACDHLDDLLLDAYRKTGS